MKPQLIDQFDPVKKYRKKCMLKIRKKEGCIQREKVER
jgi:hypothetical protein